MVVLEGCIKKLLMHWLFNWKSEVLLRANWVSDVRLVRPPSYLLPWLTDTGSLTVKLIAASQKFRVQCLFQGVGMSLSDEYQALNLSRPRKVKLREVILHCDQEPCVFAHTALPYSATALQWPFFNRLGEKSLGSMLFHDPAIVRYRMQFARLCAQNVLTRRISSYLELPEMPLFARRCLYIRHGGALLVTEVFLSTIAAKKTLSNPSVLNCRI